METKDTNPRLSALPGGSGRSHGTQVSSDGLVRALVTFGWPERARDAAHRRRGARAQIDLV